MKCVTCIVCFHTISWIKRCLSSYRKFIPNGPIVIINNNPSKGSPSFIDSYGIIREWSLKCDKEINWLQEQKEVIVIQPQSAGHLTHGKAIHEALLWAQMADFENLVHIEPDCEIFGRDWFDLIIKKVNNGSWMAGCSIAENGALKVTPTSWLIKEAINFDFDISRREGAYIGDDWGNKYWDTGQLAWSKCNENGKADYCPSTDFIHYGYGSKCPMILYE